MNSKQRKQQKRKEERLIRKVLAQISEEIERLAKENKDAENDLNAVADEIRETLLEVGKK